MACVLAGSRLPAEYMMPSDSIYVT